MIMSGRSRSKAKEKDNDKKSSLSDLPSAPATEYIEIKQRDDSSVSKSQKPQLPHERCPKPMRSLRKWLEPGWDDYTKAVVYVKDRLVIDSEQGDYECFGDSPSRVSAFENWSKRRSQWREKQLRIDSGEEYLLKDKQDREIKAKKPSEAKKEQKKETSGGKGQRPISEGKKPGKDASKKRRSEVRWKYDQKTGLYYRVLSSEMQVPDGIDLVPDNHQSQIQLHKAKNNLQSEIVNKKSQGNKTAHITITEGKKTIKDIPKIVKGIELQWKYDPKTRELIEYRSSAGPEPDYIDSVSDNLQPQKNKQESREQPEAKTDKGFNLLRYLRQNNVEYIDERSKADGCLWLVGGMELKPLIIECRTHGYSFVGIKKDSKVTNYRPSWVLKKKVRRKK